MVKKVAKHSPNHISTAFRPGQVCFSGQCRGILTALACWFFVSAFGHAARLTGHVVGALTVVDSTVSYPRGVAVDAAGNVYVAQGSSGPILKETPSATGYTSTVVATGFYNIAGLAVDSSGNVYVADRYANQVYGEMLSGGVYTQITIGSGLSNPNGVGVDSSGNVYIADTNNNRVLKEALVAGTYVQSVVDSTITGPNDVVADGSGNLFVLGGGYITKETPSGSTYSGTAVVSGAIGSAFGLAIDSAGNLIMADAGNNELVKYTLYGASYVLSAIYLQAGYPAGVATDGQGNIFFTTDTLHEISPSASFGSVAVATASPVMSLTFAFDSAGVAAAPVVLTQGTAGLDYADAGTGTCTTNGTSHAYSAGDTCTVNLIYTPAYAGTRLGNLQFAGVSINLSGVGMGFQLVFPTNSGNQLRSGITQKPNFTNPTGIALDGAGNIYVADNASSQLSIVSAVCDFASCTQTYFGDGLYEPFGIAIDGAGNIYVADKGNNAVKMVPPGCLYSSCVTTLGGGFNQLHGVAVDAIGSVYVADTANTRVARIPPGCLSASCVTTVGGGFGYVYGIAVDGIGNIYVGDGIPVATVKKMPVGCLSSTCVSTVGGGFGEVTSLVADPGGNVFVADYGAGVAKEIPVGCLSSNCVVTIQNSGYPYFEEPYGVALDAKGNLFVSDTERTVLESFLYNTPQSRSFPTTAVGSSSAQSVVNVLNDGNSPLAISALTGTNANFGGAATTCSTSTPLAIGGTCSLGIEFAPTAVGTPLTGSANILGPAASVALTIPVSGNSTAPPPSVSAVSPNSGAIAGGTAVTITGTNFLSGATVHFGTTAATNVVVVSATSITATAPAGSTGTVDVTVILGSSTSSTSSADQFTYVSSPTVSAVSPGSGPSTGGTPVTITGSNFASGASVHFGATAATNIVYVNATTITATAPAGSGSVAVTVTTTTGTSTTGSGDVFSYLTASTTVSSTTLTRNHAATSFSPVAGSGGTGTLTYSVTPDLPAGMSFSSAGVLSGTPTAVSTATTYTVTVTDSNSASSTATFSLTVNSAVSATTSVSSTTLTRNHAATAFNPVAGSGGTGTLTYSLNTDLPAGLSFSSAGVLSGTPTTVSAATTYTVTATDSNGASSTATFSLAVNSAVSATTAVSTTALTQNHATTAFTPVTGAGGTGTLTFGVTPALPAGLNLSSSGTLSGTPTGVGAAATYTVTVTDANGASSTATFSLTVNSAVSATTTVSATILTRNHAATAFSPVAGSGGTGTVTYSINTDLPAGLSLSSAGVLSGTPTAVSAATTYTVTVTDSNGSSSTATFSLTVNNVVAATTAVSATTLTQNHAATAFSPVTGSGGTGTLTYSIASDLPAGLTFSSAGVLSGTPTTVSAATTYTVTVTDSNGSSSTATFSLTVNSAVGATTAVSTTVLTQSHATTAFSPVTGAGGTGTLAFSVAPALPAGLSLSSNGALSGTPTVVSAAATYTVTVADANGASSTAPFNLTVNSAVGATTAVAATALTQSHAATAFMPVTGSGGTGTLTYSIGSDLLAGLSFSSTGVLSGTPTAVSPATTYTVTVTDTNAASSAATFSLTVNRAVSSSVAISMATLTQNHTPAAFVPVTGSGGTGTLTYSVSPALPAGLSFSSNGTVSGTPTVVSPTATYTVTVTDTNGASSSSSFSLSVNVAIATSTVVTSSNLTPNFGTSVVLTATVTPAPADTPPGTASFYSGSTLLGAAALNSAGVATLTINLPLGQDTITSVYSGSARYAGSTSSPLSVSDRTGSAITISASPTSQLYSNPIVLNAQVSSTTAGTLSGTVSFLDGSTLIGTAAIGAGGQATYSVTSLSDGSHSISATYSGDGNYLASASSSIPTAITVSDLNLNLGGDQSQSVVPGAAVSYTFPLSPLVTPTFLYDVHLTATGLPPGATYTFSPAMIPAGNSTMPVTLTVQTSNGVGALEVPAAPGKQNRSHGLTMLSFGLLLPLLGARRVKRRLQAMPKLLAMALLATISMGAMLGLSGCGGGGYFGPTATSGTYTITVTATSADLVRVSTVQLTIQ